MAAITPFLWFDDQAEKAAEHYVSIFKNSRILDVSRYVLELLADPDPARSSRVMRAMLAMGKIEIAQLRAAYDGESPDDADARLGLA
jgi:predicted 3-demethylubiquinone-9 3-methyltransferase (glyoxalase superfamily)